VGIYYIIYIWLQPLTIVYTSGSGSGGVRVDFFISPRERERERNNNNENRELNEKKIYLQPLGRGSIKLRTIL